MPHHLCRVLGLDLTLTGCSGSCSRHQAQIDVAVQCVGLYRHNSDLTPCACLNFLHYPLLKVVSLISFPGPEAIYIDRANILI